MAAAKEITLKVNIDPSGAVSGAKAVAGGAAEATEAIRKINVSLGNLNSAYAIGRSAVDKYNTEMAVLDALEKHNLDTKNKLGKELAESVRQNIALVAAVKANEQALRAQEAAERSALSAKIAKRKVQDESAVALYQEVQALKGLYAAYQSGEGAVDAYNKKMFIKNALLEAGRTLQSQEGQAVAADAAKHWDLTAAISAAEKAARQKAAAFEAAHAEALADAAAMQRAKEATDQFINSVQNEVNRLQGLAAAYSGGRAGIAAFNLAHEIQTRQMRQGVSATSEAGQAIEKFTRQEYAAREAVDKLEKELKAQEKATQQIKPTTDKATHGVNAFQVAVASLATVALNRLKNEIVGARQSFDRMTNTFAVSSGSAAEAAEKMSFLRGNAQRLGLDIQSVGVSFAKFDVAAQNTSLSSKQIRDIFVSVSEATTAMGLSSEVAEGAILALQQMISKGTVQSEELRGQFAERIPGAFRLAAEAMGWTQLELAKNLEQGRVLSEDLLPKLAAKLHEVFGPGSVSGSKLLSAEINRLKNEWFDFLVQTSQDIKLPQLIKAISDSFEVLTFAAKTFLALGLIVYFPVLYEKITLLASSMKAAAVAANEFWVAMLGGKVGISAIITALIIAGYELNQAINDWKTESSTAMSGYVADGEKVVVQLGNIRDLYIELNKLNPFNQEGGTPNVTEDMLKAINEEVSRNEENLKSNISRMEELKRKLASPSENYNTNYNGMGGFSIDLDAIESDRKEYESLIGTTGVLSEKLKTLKERQFDAKQEMFNAAATSKVADDALKEYDKTVADISARYSTGKLAHLGGKDLSAAEQYAEYMRQLADARKAYDQAIAPGRAQVEAKEMRQQVKEANEYTKALDQLIKKYDEKRYAEEAAIAAHALVEDAYDKERLGAKGSEEALRNLNTVHEQVSATLQEKLHEGYGSVMADITKFNSETQDSIDVINRMVEAQTMSAEGLLEAERNEAIYGKTKDLVTKYKMLGLNATEKESQAERDYRETMEESIRVAQELAGVEFDRARSLGISENLRKTTEELEKAIVAQHEYNKIVAQGPAAVEEYAIQQEALAAAYAAGARTAEELKAATAILVPYLKTLKEETKDGLGKKMIDDLKYETEWMNKYAIALSKGAGAVEAFNIAKQVSDALRNNQVSKEGAIELEAALKESSLAKIRVQLAQITADFKEDMWSGLESSLNTFFQELGEGNKDAIKNLGKSLEAAMLDAVAKWLSAMLVAIARAALASKAISGGSAAGGGGGFMGALKGIFGGGAGAGGGISSGAMALGAWVAIAAAAVAILKHQSDRANAVRYQTIVQYNTGSNNIGFGGKLMETGGKIATAFKALLDEITSSTGALLEGAHRAVIAVRNDKKGFRALVDGVVVGTFKTMDEAIVAAMKRLFSAENLKNQLDPIVQQVIDNFDAKKGPQAFSDAIKAVTQIMNGLSGLTDIEIQLRDMPSQAAALAAKLHEMGVAISDATEVAGRWTVQQFQSIRDQITGHQMTEAEQRAEKERQALYFNAQLALAKANMAIRRDEIASQIAALKAKAEINNWKYELDKWELEGERAFAQQGAEIAQAEMDVRYAAGQASIAMLEAQLAAVNQALAALDAIKPIDLREIHIGNPRGRGGGNSGPSEAEQRAEAFWAFMEQQMMDAMTPVERQLYELNKAFHEQEQAARELGQVEELEAARIAAITRLRNEFLEGYRLEGLTEYQRAVEELNAAFADQALLDGDLAGGEAELARARQQAMARLREDLLDSFGSSLESTRDNLQKWIKQFADLDSANADLYKSFLEGSITAEEYAAAIAHSNQVQQEFNDQMAVSLLNMASFFTDALGNEKQSAAVRARLAEFEYNLKLAEFQITLETAYAQHWINQELYDFLSDILKQARENPPDFTVPTGGGGGGGSDSGTNPLEDMLQALLRALDRLRNIMQTYTDFLMGLQTSELSPYSIEQQYNSAQAEYQRLLALAQAGNLDAIEALPGAAQTYLELAAQMFGTASAGYNEIFQGINNDMHGIMDGIQDILDAVPSQYQPIEQRLDTIAEILANMYLLWMNFDTGTGGNGGSGGNHHPPTTTNPMQSLMQYIADLTGGLTVDERTGLEDLITRYLSNDGVIDNLERESILGNIQRLMEEGTITAAQAAAIMSAIGHLPYVITSPQPVPGGTPPPTPEPGPTVGSFYGGSSNAAVSQTNKHLQALVDIQAKALRDSANDRYRKPKFGYAGYAGGNSASRRS